MGSDDPFWYPATKQAYRTAKILNFDITVFAPKGRGEAGTLEMVHFLKRCWRSVMMESVSHPLRISEWKKIAAEDGREGCGGDFSSCLHLIVFPIAHSSELTVISADGVPERL